MTYTKQITLDVAKTNRVYPISAKQYDTNSRFLSVTVTKDGTPVTVSADSEAIINIRRADGEAKAFSCTVNSDGTVAAPIPNWALEIDGQAVCDISNIASGDEKLTTHSFALDIERAAYGNGDISQDENYDILTELIDEVSEVKECAPAVMEAAEAARESAEAAQAAVGKTSYIGDNGNWFEWDSNTGGFIDTGKPSKGEKGDTGDQGNPGSDADVTAENITAALGYTPAQPEGNYELIETITLTEDTASIIRTEEPDGTPYNFESLIIKSTSKSGGATSVYTYAYDVNNKSAEAYNSNYSGTPNGYSYTMFLNHNGYTHGYGSNGSTDAGSIVATLYSSSFNHTCVSKTPIVKFKILPIGGVIKSDSVIEVLAVRA